MATSTTAQAPSAAWRAAPAGRLGNRASRAFMALSFAEVRLAHLGVSEERRRAVRERDETALHHVAAMADLERELGILLDQQQRYALGGDRAYGLEDLLHHLWRESHAGFIEQQHPRPAHERPPDRQHLLLAPG